MTAEKSWGSGRVAFVAHLDKIKAEVAQAIPLKTIFSKYEKDLGIGYQAFCKLVNRYAPAERQAAIGEVTPRRRAPEPAPLPPKSDPTTQQEKPDVRDDKPASVFDYKPFVGPGDKERLVGPAKRKD